MPCHKIVGLQSKDEQHAQVNFLDMQLSGWGACIGGFRAGF
jgi:hypothetical protein